MKYLFINVVAGIGSTGRIAADKCRELQANGNECVLAYGRGKADCDDIRTYRIGTKWDHIVHGIGTRMFDIHGFCSKTATKKFIRWAERYDPDVIWLHNIHGYYINVELLFAYIKKTDKKVFWTLHDCWSFTGHCAYFTYAECDKWKTLCGHCVQKCRYPKSILFDNSKRNFERKRKAFCGVKYMTLITPSQWLANLTKKSFLREYPVKVVRNMIDRNLFRPTESNFRKRYGLTDRKMILGVASTWEARKGLDDYKRLAEMLGEDYGIVLVGLNKRQRKNLPDYILGLPRTKNANRLAEIYTAADIFVNLSHEENYPTVNLEAQACGTPVITYDAGGAGETLDEENKSNLIKGGRLVEVKEMIERISLDIDCGNI